MAEEIQEAVQIIRVAYGGIEIAMKAGSGGIGAMQKAMEFLKGMIDYEKNFGKTSMRKLLMRGGDLQIFQYKTADMNKVKKMAKKYGILYSMLPDINKKDGMSEIIFHSEAVPRINLMIQKLKSGRIASIDDYLNNGNKQEINQLLNFLKGQKTEENRDKKPIKIQTEKTASVDHILDGMIEKAGLFAVEQQSISAQIIQDKFGINKEQAETMMAQLQTIGVLENKEADGVHKVIMDKEAFLNRMKGYQALEERIKAVSESKNLNITDVTISNTLIQQENEHAVKTRIPGTWGKDAEYIWIDKKNIMDIHKNKTLLTFLDRKKDYKIYDEDNHVIKTIKGEELYSGHYDKVETAVRVKYEKSVKQGQEKIKKQTVVQKR